MMLDNQRASSLRVYRTFLVAYLVWVGVAQAQPITEQTAEMVDIERVDPIEFPEPPDLNDFLPPLEAGPYVNFESAVVKALAYDAESKLLILTNTPNNSLAIYDATQTIPLLKHEVFVGLDPVSVAFEPNSGGERAWVVNRISDTVVQVDLQSAAVLSVIEVGDEPVNILMNAAGTHAFVVEYGYANERLSVIDVQSKAVVATLDVDCETPMAAAYDPANEVVYVAAHLSGNNTTVVGGEFRTLIEQGNSADDFLASTIIAAAGFSLTRPLFEASEYAPLFPDSATGLPSPISSRIVPDKGVGGSWQGIVDQFTESDGTPRVEALALFETEIEGLTGQTVTNVEELFTRMWEEYIDTLDYDVRAIDVSQPSQPVLHEHAENVGTVLTGMAMHPTESELWVSNLEALNLITSEPNLKGHFFDHRVSRIATDAPLSPTLASVVDLHGHILNFNDVSGPNLEAQRNSLANPTDIVFSDDGTRAYVAALGTGRIGVLDGQTMAVLGLADVGRGTRSLAINSPANRLYAYNRTDNSVVVVDVSTDQPVVIATVTVNNPEPVEIKRGRNFLYSTRFSNNFASSCAMCHVDAHLDRIAWDLGDPTSADMQFAPFFPKDPDQENPCLEDMRDAIQNHPVKGPMTTMSLRGLRNHEPLHWRGDKELFQDFNGAFSALLGGQELSNADMDDFADFVKTIVYPPNHAYLTRDFLPKEGLDVIDGIRLYVQFGCLSCHEPEHDGAKSTDCFEAGDLGDFIDSPLKQSQFIVTQLRGLPSKGDGLQSGFGLVHDGIATKFTYTQSALDTFMRGGFGMEGEDAQKVAAFMRAFPTNVMPVVGWQVLITGPDDQAAVSDILVMLSQQQAEPSRCDIVAKHYDDGIETGYLFLGGDLVERSDGQVLRLQDLIDMDVSETSPLMIVAVPPGSGRRIGLGQTD